MPRRVAGAQNDMNAGQRVKRGKKRVGWLMGLEPTTPESQSGTLPMSYQPPLKICRSGALACPTGIELVTPVRRLVLYPVELRARLEPGTTLAIWSGWRDLKLRHPAPKAARYQARSTPEGRNYTDQGVKGQLKVLSSCLFAALNLSLHPPAISDIKAIFFSAEYLRMTTAFHTNFKTYVPEDGRGLHGSEAAGNTQEDPQSAEDRALAGQSIRTVNTMQDEATVFADPNDRASRSRIWRWNCAIAIASAN